MKLFSNHSRAMLSAQNNVSAKVMTAHSGSDRCISASVAANPDKIKFRATTRILSAAFTLGILLLSEFCSKSIAQGIPVLDTNQVQKAMLSGFTVQWRTNLYECETITFVTTTWVPTAPALNIALADGTRVMRQHEAETVITNVSHRIVYGGVERIFPVSHTTGPTISTRYNDSPVPLPENRLALPLRFSTQHLTPK